MQKRKNTALEVSGKRIDHIAALSKERREMITQLLSIPYLTGTKYDDWNNENINWIPKEQGNDGMRKRRSLMYYEVMRKVYGHDNGTTTKRSNKSVARQRTNR